MELCHLEMLSFYKRNQNIRALSFIDLTLIGRVLSLLDGFGVGVNFSHVLSEASLYLLPMDLMCTQCVFKLM